jgi:hypothetical protein
MLMESQASPEWTLDDTALRKARGYLEGLALILDDFNAEERGKDHADPLVERLQGLQTPGIEWEALRYQVSAGTGWSHMADSVREVLLAFPPVDPDDLDQESL